MTRKLWLLSLLLLTVAASDSHAAVFERDWKNSGDGLLTFDDVNQREWLDLTESLARNIGQTDSSGTFSFDYQRDLIAELEPGGMFEGFQAATTADVVALALSAGIDPNTTDFATNGVPVGKLIDLLGPTFRGPVSSGASEAFAFGLTSDLRQPQEAGRNESVSFIFSRRDDEPTQSAAALSINLPSDITRSNTVGMMIYRQAVPEPSSIVLAMVSCLFPVRRFRR